MTKHNKTNPSDKKDPGTSEKAREQSTKNEAIKKELAKKVDEINSKKMKR
jgi:hypothetical protein